MRILQLIDSLEAGGAERMAVNYANALVEKIEFSGLVATRKEGGLIHDLDEKVEYLFLDKKHVLDLKALFRLRKFVKENKVAVVHAHGTSFFIASLLKLIYPPIRLVWHEHYGARIKQSRFDNLLLVFSSLFFSSALVINPQLEIWVKRMLFVKKVSYIPNFITSETCKFQKTFLRGTQGKRIVCVANLKNPKNHILLLKVFKDINLKDLGWSLHLVGKDYNDLYSDSLKEFIKLNNLENHIFIYDSKDDVQHILSQGTIGVLCSTDEGFPVSLLEYGLAKLSVLSTNVGACPLIIENGVNGLLFNPLNALELREQLFKIISDEIIRSRFGINLNEFVLEKYSKETVIKKYLNWIQKI